MDKKELKSVICSAIVMAVAIVVEYVAKHFSSEARKGLSEKLKNT